jgi:hypothetical protein
MRLLFLTFVLLTTYSSMSYSAIYEWTNKQGNKAYTQTPPSDKSISRKKLDVKSKKTNDAITYTDSSEEATTSDSIEEASDVSPEEQAKKIAEGKRLIKEQCTNAQSALAGLDGGNRLYKDSKGNYLRMTEEEKDKRRKNINSFMSEHCK